MKHPGAHSARGVGEYYFNRTIAEALFRALKESGEVDAVIINPHGKSISLAERTRQAVEKRATLFLSIHHDSVQRRYLKPWNVNGKTRLFQTISAAFRCLSLPRIASSGKV